MPAQTAAAAPAAPAVPPTAAAPAMTPAAAAPAATTTAPAATTGAREATTGARAARQSRAALSGVRDMIPLVVALAPFALLIGVAVVESSVPAGAGWAGSLLLFAGTSHLAAITMLDAGANTLAVVGAVVVINARLLILSASLAPSLRHQPGWVRWVAAAVIVEPTFALATTRLSERDEPARWRRYYLAAGATLAVGWAGLIATGIALGPVVPESWPLGFAAPALMVSMLVPTLTSRPAVVAAVVGAVVAVATSDLPNALNLLLGVLAGMTAGALTDWRMS